MYNMEINFNIFTTKGVCVITTKYSKIDVEETGWLSQELFVVKFISSLVSVVCQLSKLDSHMF